MTVSCVFLNFSCTCCFPTPQHTVHQPWESPFHTPPAKHAEKYPHIIPLNHKTRKNFWEVEMELRWSMNIIELYFIILELQGKFQTHSHTFVSVLIVSCPSRALKPLPSPSHASVFLSISLQNLCMTLPCQPCKFVLNFVHFCIPVLLSVGSPYQPPLSHFCQHSTQTFALYRHYQM